MTTDYCTNLVPKPVAWAAFTFFSRSFAIFSSAASLFLIHRCWRLPTKCKNITSCRRRNPGRTQHCVQNITSSGDLSRATGSIGGADRGTTEALYLPQAVWSCTASSAKPAPPTRDASMGPGRSGCAYCALHSRKSARRLELIRSSTRSSCRILTNSLVCCRLGGIAGAV